MFTTIFDVFLDCMYWMVYYVVNAICYHRSISCLDMLSRCVGGKYMLKIGSHGVMVSLENNEECHGVMVSLEQLVTPRSHGVIRNNYRHHGIMV